MIKAFVNINKVLIVLQIRLALYLLKVIFLLPLVIIKSFGGGK